jgi:hypothetical protein
MLDKDNFYYKQSNTNLKRRLRELTSAGSEEREAFEAAVAQAKDLESRNAALETELANLKRYAI